MTIKIDSMKKNLVIFLLLFCFTQIVHAQRELVVNTTGYGFDRTTANGIHIEQWAYIQKFFNISSGGQDASVTAVRLYVTWENYEPTLGNYSNSGAKLAQAIAAIIALKPGTKVALHFPYMRNGSWNDSYFADEDIARISNGTKVQENIAFTCPSVYSQTAKTRFFAFVNDALNSISAYYSNILYIQIGNGNAEEFHIPTINLSGTVSPGFYEDKALQAWRTEYLPCRYPGQSTVVWDGNTQTISAAPAFAPNQYQDWSSEQGREYHRFASWGLMKLFKEFRDLVKSKNASLKVLYYVSYFGLWPGNVTTLHNATLPMGLAESDGIYTTDGVDQYDNLKKIMAVDVIKGTNSSKIAAMEFDPEDLGQTDPSANQPINSSLTQEWMARAYKHGADYVHLAMHFNDGQIGQLIPILASIKATYLNGSYMPPAHQAPVAENVFPTVFTGTSLFQTTYGNQGGSSWASSDISPKSISMNDNGYWQNIWSCTATNPCDFNVSGSGPASSVTAGASVTLSSTCSGQCSGTGYAWSGNGISGSATAVTFNAPATAGTYTYTVTGSKNGCTSKTANVSITVVASGGGTNPCNYTDQATVGTWSGMNVQTRSYTVNGNQAWLIVTAVAGSTTDKHFPRGANFADRTDISWTNGVINKTCLGGGTTAYGGLSIPSAITVPSGYVQGTETDGAVYFQQSGGCTTPPAPSLSASPSTITSGSSSTLTASGCSGGTITWSNGLGTGISKTVSPTTTTTYTATCTIGSCTSGNGSVTVTFTSGGGPNCSTLASNVDGVDCSFIQGWIYDQSSPNAVVNADIYDGATLILSNVPASKFRQDLLNAGFGNGAHGLEVATPAQLKNGQAHTVTIKASGCTYQLNSSPKTVTCGSSSRLALAHDETVALNQPMGLIVTPNPNNGIFETSFFIQKGKKATILVTDPQGRTIYKKTIIGQGAHRERLYLSGTSSGTLFVQLRKEDKTEVKKISVVR